ncbi:MAG: hypothetical protein QOG35_2546 [Solirubrobacteraceae bacterium]|nr:hypothetical protein [Solirubrobacteraceae bacterium]
MLEAGIGGAEGWIYVVIGVLLVVAAAFTIVGTITDLIEGSKGRPVTDSGVFVLDRVLLMFIIAELLYTLRLVDFGGRILVEPFLFIGLIAVVRRILVVTAQAEGALGHRQATDVLLQLGALGGLALILAVSIHVLRGSAPALEPEAADGRR